MSLDRKIEPSTIRRSYIFFPAMEWFLVTNVKNINAIALFLFEFKVVWRRCWAVVVVVVVVALRSLVVAVSRFLPFCAILRLLSLLTLSKMHFWFSLRLISHTKANLLLLFLKLSSACKSIGRLLVYLPVFFLSFFLNLFFLLSKVHSKKGASKSLFYIMLPSSVQSQIARL